jgi:Flp pilus assembly protein TadD
MGYCLFLQGRLDEARMNLRQAIVLDPTNERAHNNLGLMLAHVGRQSEALAEFSKAGCDEADALNNLAFVSALKGQHGEARQQYQQALAMNPASDAAKRGLYDLDAMVMREKAATSRAAIQPASYSQEIR